MTTFSVTTVNATSTTTATNDLRQSTGTVRNIIDSGDRLRVEWSARHSLNDPKVQAALRAATQVLNAQKPGYPTGSTLRKKSSSSSLTTSGSSTSTQLLGTTQAVTVTNTIGPANIFIGDNRATPFFVAAGDNNIDVLTTNTTTFQQTTTLTGGGQTVEVFERERVLFLDLDAVYSALFSGLPLALAQRDVFLGAHEAVGDVNSRVFRAMLGPNDPDVPQGDGGLGGDVRFFTSGSAGWMDDDGSDARAGGKDTRESAGIGLEWTVNPTLRLGLAATYLHSDTDFAGGLGSQEIDGGALSAYATWRGKAAYADLLYSGALFDSELHRDTLSGGTARSQADASSHRVSLNLGYVFEVTDTFSTGPYASLTYTHGSLDGATESGGGGEGLRYDAQSYDSLVSSVGWQASWKLRRSWGGLTPLLRVGWDRENLDDADTVSATLLRSPFGIASGGTVERFGGFGVSARRESARYDALSAGAAVLVEIGERWTVTLGAEGRTDFGERDEFSLSLHAGYRF